jgi:hypothetical protein
LNHNLPPRVSNAAGDKEPMGVIPYLTISEKDAISERIREILSVREKI